jgi:AcrR family transcriptional regulator
VEAPVREIADRAGVGLGTIYRHCPQRADLIAAVFRHEVDACAGAAPAIAAAHEPGEALAAWMQRYAVFLVTKRGLAPALHSGDPAMLALRDYFDENMRPALEMLLQSAVAAGKIRSDVTANDILYAVGGLCMSSHFEGIDHVQKMVAVLIDGLRYGK